MRLYGTLYVIATGVAVGLVIHARPARSADVTVSPERVGPSERVARSGARRDLRVGGAPGVGGGGGPRGRGPAPRLGRWAGPRLSLPFMDAPGVPPPLVIVDANRNGRLDRGEVRRTSGGLGFRADPDKTARNLAVPGEDTGSVFEKIAAEDIAGELVTGDVKGRDVLKFLILGLPLRAGPVSQVSRARELHSSFLLVWIGNNDVLGMATDTNPSAVTLTPQE